MCGIAGIVSRNKDKENAVRAMCEAMRHRGPNGIGLHSEGDCTLGVARLSIIDVEGGAQPMGNEDGSIWVAFNGEIYNHRELRAELEQQGHAFRTSCDTEVLVHLYERFGIGALSRIRGMFSFALWDARENKLVLARDRFGKKPLYYAAVGNELYFASELQGLLRGGFPFEVDQEALRMYFQFLYVPEPHTGIKGVRRLAPGHWMAFRVGEASKPERYWHIPVAPHQAPAGLDEAAVCVQLREKFDEAVGIRMAADVPLGAFLSGGIDSSSVVASMALQSREPVKTFSAGFANRAYNELAYAALVAKKHHTEHHELMIPEEESVLTGVVEELVARFGEPFADSSAIPTYLLAKFAAEHVKVVLSGDGGDELFAGYEIFAEAERMRAFARIPPQLRRVIRFVGDRLPYSSYGKNYLRTASSPTALEGYFEHIFVPYYLRERALQPQWMLPVDEAYYLRTLGDFLLPNGADLLAQSIYFATSSTLVADMLFKVDRASMANALEVRCPFLDHELAEFAGTIPNCWKLRDGKGKLIIFRAWGERFPPELFVRPKMGFAAPVSHWLRGLLRNYLQDHLGSARFLQRDLISRPFLQELIREHENLRRDNSRWLWGLLMLELWFERIEQTRSSVVSR